jgi:hypothetical protein
MMATLTSMATVRVLTILGFAVGWWFSVVSTFQHIGVERQGPPHAWYHFFREGGLDIGVQAAVLIILFAAPRFRTPVTWQVMAVLMVGYYAPFWVGGLYMSELSPPGGYFGRADWAHIVQAFFPVLALFLGRKHFYENPPTTVTAPAARVNA